MEGQSGPVAAKDLIAALSVRSSFVPKRTSCHGRKPTIRLGSSTDANRPEATCNDAMEISFQSRAMIIPPAIHAPDAIGDCGRARVVRAAMEHGIYRRPQRPRPVHIDCCDTVSYVD